MFSTEFEWEGGSKNIKTEVRMEERKLKVACMLETNNGFHRQNWLLA